MPGYIHLPAKEAKSGKKVGIISRSGTLTYEAVWQCASRGIGQTTAVGIGGDPVKGLNFIELISMFNNDPETDAIIMIGEIGGSDEADAARFVKANVKKPVVGFIAGRTAPAGKRMGHAGAIISGGDDTADAKLKTFRECGITVSESPATIGEAMAKALGIGA
jgi:succinyl-CoA synthetase alpha subunit